MQQLFFNIFLIKIILLFNTCAFTSNFSAWIKNLEPEVIDYGISKKTFDKTLSQLKEVNKKVLKLYNNQPEFKITFDSYYNKNINTKKVQLGKDLLEKHSKILQEIYLVYRVPPEIIVSIWGIETNYGSYMGKFNVIEALASLAYSSKRKKFFKKELLSSLLIYERNFKDSNKILMGSWAGAMGQGQFMPSSFLNYAIDYDKDNIIDIWSSHKDIFASISNYLKLHGWEKNKYWSKEIKLKKKVKENIKEDGYYDIDMFEDDFLTYFSNSSKIQVKVIKSNLYFRYFAIDKNFSIIKKYNNSDFYSLIVGDLANKIKKIN